MLVVASVTILCERLWRVVVVWLGCRGGVAEGTVPEVEALLASAASGQVHGVSPL